MPHVNAEVPIDFETHDIISLKSFSEPDGEVRTVLALARGTFVGDLTLANARRVNPKTFETLSNGESSHV